MGMESIFEIFKRKDVRFYLQKKESRWRRYYRNHYGKKFVNIFYMHAFQLAYHRYASNTVNRQLDLKMTQIQIDIFMAMYTQVTTWGVGCASRESVFKRFFEGHLTYDTFRTNVRKLGHMGIIHKVKWTKMKLAQKEIVRQYAIGSEALYGISDRGLAIPHTYNIAMGMKTMEASKEEMGYQELKKMISIIDGLKKELFDEAAEI